MDADHKNRFYDHKYWATRIYKKNIDWAILSPIAIFIRSTSAIWPCPQIVFNISNRVQISNFWILKQHIKFTSNQKFHLRSKKKSLIISMWKPSSKNRINSTIYQHTCTIRVMNLFRFSYRLPMQSIKLIEKNKHQFCHIHELECLLNYIFLTSFIRQELTVWGALIFVQLLYFLEVSWIKLGCKYHVPESKLFTLDRQSWSI